VMHAQLKIGDSMVMISDAMDKYPAMPTSLYLYVKDTDAAYRSAIKAGGVSIMEPMTQFYGDRNAGVKDPAGNQWWVATHIEDLTPQEVERRQKEFMEKQSRG
jgi:PhnB protein